MAKFKFRMQSFLNLKEKIEDQRRMEYGKALSALEEEKQKKHMLETEKADRINEFSSMVLGSVKPVMFAHYNLYIEVLKKRIIEQEKQVAAAKAEVERRRVELVEAMREKKMLQTLKDKEYESFLIEEKRQEQRVVDEIVSYKYSNNGQDIVMSGDMPEREGTAYGG